MGGKGGLGQGEVVKLFHFDLFLSYCTRSINIYLDKCNLLFCDNETKIGGFISRKTDRLI